MVQTMDLIRVVTNVSPGRKSLMEEGIELIFVLSFPRFIFLFRHLYFMIWSSPVTCYFFFY